MPIITHQMEYGELSTSEYNLVGVTTCDTEEGFKSALIKYLRRVFIRIRVEGSRYRYKLRCPCRLEIDRKDARMVPAVDLRQQLE